MDNFQLLAPKHLSALIDDLKKITKKSKILAGGTDLIICLREGKLKPDVVIDLSGVKELNYIRLEKDNMHIGAMTTFSDIQKNELIKKYASCLAQSASEVGSTQIRNAATLGGNIANASPAGDNIPVLMALNAKVRIVDSLGNIEELEIDDMILGSGETTLNHDQVIIGIVFPILREGYKSTFVKVGTRSTVSIARLNMALVIAWDQDSKKVYDIRIALGAVGTKALRDVRVEKMLLGQCMDEKLNHVLAEELSNTVQQAIPGRYSLPYKKETIKGLAHDAYENIIHID